MSAEVMGDSLTGVGTVCREWAMDYTMVYKCLPLVRLHVRRKLVLWGWPGDQEEATLIASELVTTAISHGRVVGHTMRVRLALLDDGALLIDVSDPVPAFPDFNAEDPAGAEDERGRGLELVRGLGAELAWFLRVDGGKTVRAHLGGR
ncbi:ATP-binding protein [Streptomyces sp. NPDC048527]|uniref:ATP-binding protein n=1 Tax=Streptomyces sp. NPDC048527 TaxID=3365568 RepID=UPI00371B0D8D